MEKIKKLRNKIKGSVLVYTLIILGIILATALSITAVSVIEQRGAGDTAKSVQSFATADSGAEIAINKLRGGSGDLTSIGCIDNKLEGSVGESTYSVTFHDTDDNQLTCADSISSVARIKSTGKYAGTARAVEVAVAAGPCVDGTQLITSSSNSTFTPGNEEDIIEFIEQGDGLIASIYCNRGPSTFDYIPFPTVGISSSGVEFGDTGFNVSCKSTCVGGSTCTGGWSIYGSCTCDRSC